LIDRDRIAGHLARRVLSRPPRAQVRHARLIDVRDLSIVFDNRGVKVPALDRVSFSDRAGFDAGTRRRSGSGSR
jgi:hypothetical protein